MATASPGIPYTEIPMGQSKHPWLTLGPKPAWDEFLPELPFLAELSAFISTNRGV